jgi:hypothetical protein
LKDKDSAQTPGLNAQSLQFPEKAFIPRPPPSMTAGICNGDKVFLKSFECLLLFLSSAKTGPSPYNKSYLKNTVLLSASASRITRDALARLFFPHPLTLVLPLTPVNYIQRPFRRLPPTSDCRASFLIAAQAF